VKVVELAGIGPSPFAGMMLADLGADVLRVAAPRRSGLGAEQQSGAVLNRGRATVTLDLKTDDDRARVMRLLDQADALIEGFRPGVMERLGLAPDRCLERNRRLVYTRITGWGQAGPDAASPGHDINYLGLAGTLSLLGRAGQPPTPPANLLGDFGGGGMFAVVGTLAALLHARATGRGQVVDASIMGGSAALASMVHALMAGGQWGARGTNVFDTGAPYYEVYRTADDGWMAVAATAPASFETLCCVLEVSVADLPPYTDRTAWPELRRRLTAAFATRSRAEWELRFAQTEACATPVLNLAEAAEHPHSTARGQFIDVGGVLQAAPEPRFSLTPTAAPTPPRHGVDAVLTALTAWGFRPQEAAEIAQRNGVDEAAPRDIQHSPPGGRLDREAR